LSFFWRGLRSAPFFLLVGDIKKTNACDAQHLLKLLLEDSFY
jgi:hypothetical protein